MKVDFFVFSCVIILLVFFLPTSNVMCSEKKKDLQWVKFLEDIIMPSSDDEDNNHQNIFDQSEKKNMYEKILDTYDWLDWLLGYIGLKQIKNYVKSYTPENEDYKNDVDADIDFTYCCVIDDKHGKEMVKQGRFIWRSKRKYLMCTCPHTTDDECYDFYSKISICRYILNLEVSE